MNIYVINSRSSDDMAVVVAESVEQARQLAHASWPTWRPTIFNNEARSFIVAYPVTEAQLIIISDPRDTPNKIQAATDLRNACDPNMRTAY